MIRAPKTYGEQDYFNCELSVTEYWANSSYSAPRAPLRGSMNLQIPGALKISLRYLVMAHVISGYGISLACFGLFTSGRDGKARLPYLRHNTFGSPPNSETFSKVYCQVSYSGSKVSHPKWFWRLGIRMIVMFQSVLWEMNMTGLGK